MKTDHLVPLGPNKTRDGREARVICIDRQSSAHKPVLALVWNDRGNEEIYAYEVDGRTNTRCEELRDLVGHLTPATDELEDLRAWKESAMRVLGGIQLQEIGKELNLPLGTDIGPQILPAIRRLAKIEAALNS